MYEGLFDDVDFSGMVEGMEDGSVATDSPKIEARLGSLSGALSGGGLHATSLGPLSPVLEAAPGASPCGSDAMESANVFAGANQPPLSNGGKLRPLGPPSSEGGAAGGSTASLPPPNQAHEDADPSSIRLGSGPPGMPWPPHAHAGGRAATAAASAPAASRNYPGSPTAGGVGVGGGGQMAGGAGPPPLEREESGGNNRKEWAPAEDFSSSRSCSISGANGGRFPTIYETLRRRGTQPVEPTQGSDQPAG